MLEEQIRESIEKLEQELELAMTNLTAWEVKMTKLRIQLDETKKKVRFHQDKVAHVRGALCICQVILENEGK